MKLSSRVILEALLDQTISVQEAKLLVEEDKAYGSKKEMKCPDCGCMLESDGSCPECDYKRPMSESRLLVENMTVVKNLKAGADLKMIRKKYPKVIFKDTKNGKVQMMGAEADLKKFQSSPDYSMCCS